MLKIPHTKILVRRTEKWKEISSDQHFLMVKDKNTHSRPEYKPEKYLDNLQKWNQYFSKSYPEYRQKLKDLSFDSFLKTGLSIEAPQSFRNGDKYFNKPYLPTDDDDWYHPEISQVDQYFSNPLVKMVYWQAWIFHITKNSTYDGSMFSTFGERQGKWMASNGYAVRSSRWGFYTGHTANQLKAYKPEEVVYIDKPLSVWVQHPASIWELQSFDKPNTNITKMQPIPKELEWAAKYIEDSYEFTKNCLRS